MKREMRRIIVAAGSGILLVTALAGVQVTESRYVATRAAQEIQDAPRVCSATCVASSGEALCAHAWSDGECAHPRFVQQSAKGDCAVLEQQACEGFASNNSVVEGTLVEIKVVELAAPGSER